MTTEAHATAGVTTTEDLHGRDSIIGASVGSRFGHDNYHDAKLIAATQVTNAHVFNGDGEKLGWLDEVVIEKATGRVAYVVLAFGGFLGFNEKYAPLPWDRMTYDEEKGGYNIDAGHEQIHAMEKYDREGMNDYARGVRMDDSAAID